MQLRQKCAADELKTADVLKLRQRLNDVKSQLEWNTSAGNQISSDREIAHRLAPQRWGLVHRCKLARRRTLLPHEAHQFHTAVPEHEDLDVSDWRAIHEKYNDDLATPRVDDIPGADALLGTGQENLAS